MVNIRIHIKMYNHMTKRDNSFSLKFNIGYNLIQDFSVP